MEMRQTDDIFREDVRNGLSDETCSPCEVNAAGLGVRWQTRWREDV